MGSGTFDAASRHLAHSAMLKFFLAVLLALAAFSAPAAEPPVNRTVVGGTVYHCYRDPEYAYPVCVKVGTTLEKAPTWRELAQLQAARETALFVQPRSVPLKPTDPVAACGNSHGHSACCRVTAVLPNGDYIIECGER